MLTDSNEWAYKAEQITPGYTYSTYSTTWPYPHPCPGCGRCPVCGRGSHYHDPYYPYYPTYPNLPWQWQQPLITWSAI